MKADYGGSHTPKELCDRWQTPLPLFTALDAEFGFYLDAAADTVDEVRLITGGRISFINAGTNKPVNGNNKGSMLLIWRPYIKPRKIISTVDRDELMNIGNQILNEWKIA